MSRKLRIPGNSNSIYRNLKLPAKLKLRVLMLFSKRLIKGTSSFMKWEADFLIMVLTGFILQPSLKRKLKRFSAPYLKEKIFQLKMLKNTKQLLCSNYAN